MLRGLGTRRRSDLDAAIAETLRLEEELQITKLKLAEAMAQLFAEAHDRTGSAANLRENALVSNKTSTHVSNKTSTHDWLLRDVPHPDMSCDVAVDLRRRCCLPWEVTLAAAIDEWWTHHPDWHVVEESAERTCFAKYPEPKATFFRELYQMQWLYDGKEEYSQKAGNDIYQREELPENGRKCYHLYKRFQMMSGYGSNFIISMHGFSRSHALKRPFALAKSISDSVWMYTGGQKSSSWSWCPTTDLNCFVLPIGNCFSINGDANGGQNEQDVLNAFPEENAEEYAWLTEYLLRYRFDLRRRVQLRMKELFDKYPQHYEDRHMTKNCTTIHVRRSDAALYLEPFRRYIGLAEYIKAGEVPQDEAIVLITDDVSTIQEVMRFYPDYTWIYFESDRRNSTFGSWGNHISSERDPGDDFVLMVAEAAVVSQCRRLVHSDSGFVSILASAYLLAERRRPEEVGLDQSVSEEVATAYTGERRHDRAKAMMEAIFREAAHALEVRAGARDKRSDASRRAKGAKSHRFQSK